MLLNKNEMNACYDCVHVHILSNLVRIHVSIVKILLIKMFNNPLISTQPHFSFLIDVTKPYQDANEVRS